MKTKLMYVFTGIIYFWGCIWYDKKYLTGRFFDRYHYTIGWKLILKHWFSQKVLGNNRHVPFPTIREISISCPNNLIFDSHDIDNFLSKGCYFQAINGKIYIGKGTKIAPNCGFITTNHDLNDLEKHSEGKDIVIGKDCWIGMNSMILPGVELGEHTIVGAGSVVTKSFKEGNCVIAGNPAKIIRKL